MSKEKQHTDDSLGIEQALSRTERYIEENQRIISIILGAIVLVVGGFFLFRQFYLKPLNNDAQSNMWGAVRYFEQDSFRIALEGDGNVDGFIDVIDEYSRTKAGNLARYYAGICHLHLGEFEEAIEYLSDYKPKGDFMPALRLGAIGDAHRELGDRDKALEHYLDAVEASDNNFTAPFYLLKAARLCEYQKQYDKALELFEQIKLEYPLSTEATEIDKYIAKVQILKGK